MTNICLLSLSYPPYGTDTISCQRRILANELAYLGHNVHVVTLGASSQSRKEGGVFVHRVPSDGMNSSSAQLDKTVSQSLALYEGLHQILGDARCDIVDIPFWEMQGFVTQFFSNLPVVLWLHTRNNRLSEEEKTEIPFENLLLKRAGALLVDSQGTLNAIQQTCPIRTASFLRVAHFGLSPLLKLPDRKNRKLVEALVMGDLDKRKETPLLFKLLPDLLRQHSELLIRFIGRDNSTLDGWQTAHRVTYSQYFRRQYPDLADRVLFDEYINELDAQQHYEQADLLLSPSFEEEAFGLKYLNAMRTGLPVVAFPTDIAREIFAGGEADGAFLVPEDNQDRLFSAISSLVKSPALRYDLGQSGLKRFQSAFTAGSMAEMVSQLYQEVLAQKLSANQSTEKIYQVMEALDFGDAVSSISLNGADLLEEFGQPVNILARHANEKVRTYTAPRWTILSEPDCGLIFHYWGYNHSTWMIYAASGRKALYYHNITPPHFYPPHSDEYRVAAQGTMQLKSILDRFDLLIGDSLHNIQSIVPFLNHSVPSLVIYPIVDPEKVRAIPYNGSLLKQLRENQRINILFVGRIARNKRQDRLMKAFEYYYRYINRFACLWLVGNDSGDPSYRSDLEKLRISLSSRDNIHFTGKVSDDDLYAYYRLADAFVSASEHEGFGVPLVEAMAFDVPVIAYAAASIPETLGTSGILINQWDDLQVAELMHQVISTDSIRHRIIMDQQLNLGRFSGDEARIRLGSAVSFLLTGNVSDPIQIQHPVKE